MVCSVGITLGGGDAAVFGRQVKASLLRGVGGVAGSRMTCA